MKHKQTNLCSFWCEKSWGTFTTWKTDFFFPPNQNKIWKNWTLPLQSKCYLGQASLLSPGRDLVGVGLQHPPVLLTVLLVFRPGVAFPQGPVHAHLQGLLQVSEWVTRCRSFHSQGRPKSKDDHISKGKRKSYTDYRLCIRHRARCSSCSQQL